MASPTTNEPRALSAALSGPAFVTAGAGMAMHVANRHVERWAPEAGASKVRSLRSLGFVDRLVAPWIETTQRTSSLRQYTNLITEGPQERASNDVSWVFPRPWYQDELDWMAAARQPRADGRRDDAMLTTRGTYVPSSEAVPSALREFVAPSLSLARPITTQPLSHAPSGQAYSPIVPFAAVHAAELASRTVGAAPATTMSPGLRSVLATMLERSARPQPSMAPLATRLSNEAPELETPPSPRDPAMEQRRLAPSASSLITSVTVPTAGDLAAVRFAEQQAQIADVQRVARQLAERELARRAADDAVRVAQARSADQARSAEEQARASAGPATERAAAERAIAERAAAERASSDQLSATERAIRDRVAARASDATTEAATAAARATIERQVQARQSAPIATPPVDTKVVEQRIVERAAQQQQNFHERARAEAASHVRALNAAAADEQRRGVETARQAEARAQVPAIPTELATALGALPPELATAIGRRPERALQAIDELGETLRAAELYVRAAASGASFEPTRGPRIVMPAGIGGLVSTLQRAPMIAPDVAPSRDVRRPMTMGAGTTALMQADAMLASPSAAAARRDAVRAPSMTMMAASMPAPAALSAVASAAPAALHHVAWSDRWLARFAGANQQSLDVVSRVSHLGVAAGRLEAFGDFGELVAPQDDIRQVARTASAASREILSSSSPSAVESPAAALSSSSSSSAPIIVENRVPAPSMRFDDSAETPDDVFAAISAAASRGRSAPRPAAPDTRTFVAPSEATNAAAVAALEAAAAAASTPSVDSWTAADIIARSTPSAPSAGLSALLASSPFAPALRHVMPMSAAPRFDVRALFGDAVSAGYLSGLIAPAVDAIQIGSFGRSFGTVGGLVGGDLASDSYGDAGVIERGSLDWDPAYVSPDDGSTPSARSAFAHDVTTPTDPSMLSSAETTAIASTREAAIAEVVRAMPALTTLRTALLAWESNTPAAYASPALSTLAFSTEPSLVAAMGAGASHRPGSGRSPFAAAYLGGDIDDGAAGSPFVGQAFTGQVQRAASDAPSLTTESYGSLADGFDPAWFAPSVMGMTMPRFGSVAMESMSMPLGGSLRATSGMASTQPGMLAARALDWSVAQERSSADLSFDFVTPELVLAAKVYGLGAGEAAQAARLAIVGPSQLSAMAGAVDRTFVQALAIDAIRRQPEAFAAALGAGDASVSGAGSSTTASSSSLGSGATAADLTAAMAGDAAAAQRIITAYPAMASTMTASGSTFGDAASYGASGWTFGVERRMPRGAFLWPPAAVAALGLDAAGPDGNQSMSIAALELLAAQTVVELGTYASAQDGVDSVRASAFAADGGLSASTSTSSSSSSGASVSTGDARRDGTSASALGGDLSEADVLESATAMVEPTRRSRFEAMYLALGRSQASRSWSPAARAARALALANRGDEQMSPRERAALAWGVLPIVSLADMSDEMSAFVAPGAGSRSGAAGSSFASSSGTFARGAGSRSGAGWTGDMELTGGGDTRPGMAKLSSRAGEALESYVTAAGAEPSSSSSSSSANQFPGTQFIETPGAVLRPPTASPELVRQGRSAGRFGGGEVEIPSWFEQAARRMLAEQTGSSSDGISLAELTLVTTTSSNQIAASSRSAPSAAPAAPAAGADHGSGGPGSIDVEKAAHEVYKQILVLMDAARARNGDFQ